MTEEKEKYALIVDDELTIRMVNKVVLSKFGFKTLIAENGKKAVELCRSGVHFDLITMDFQMPVMDGVKATKTLRDMGVHCKIVAVTASEETNVKKMFKEAGVDHFFTKPLTAAKLDTFIKNM